MRQIPIHDRLVRLRNLGKTPPGYIHVARCRDCGHMASLPVAALLKRFGELFPLEHALSGITCAECGKSNAEAKMMRLCEPGCPKQRG